MNIIKPTAVIWKKRAINNIKIMHQKANNSGVEFRPHFKSHQSATIGKWFLKQGINKITVSSVEMAEYFAKHGWKDITIAFTVNIREINKINKLALSIDSLHLLVESGESVKFLTNQLTCNVNIWIKIDIGYYRTGILFNNFQKVLQLVKEIEKSQNLTFSGLLTHAGHSYGTKSKEDKLTIYDESISRLNKLKKFLRENGIEIVKLSYGDTPTCSIVENFEGVDEIRPGNFVFYDLVQLEIGSCSQDDIAIVIACPVVAKHADRLEVVIYGGGVHFSKDYVKSKDGDFFGYLVEKKKNGTWGKIQKENILKSISQEHGILKVNQLAFEELRIGDIVYVLPAHSCMAMDLSRNSLHFID
jgi:D-serine deaminase-like pyridoxal phosphate-dependent protein